MHPTPLPLRAVFFDVDGVLLDSLSQYLQFYNDKAREYGLQGLQLPTVAAFKRMLGRGVGFSSMLDLLLAGGFPPPLAKRGMKDYERVFVQRYRPAPFPGIQHMLKRLADAGLALGLVTFSTRANVEPALTDAMRYFDRRCLFYSDRYSEPGAKTRCLAEGARILGLAPAECIYVGDQSGDATAAEAAGLRFLGVSYGFGLKPRDASVYTVNSVPAIADALLASAARQA